MIDDLAFIYKLKLFDHNNQSSEKIQSYFLPPSPKFSTYFVEVAFFLVVTGFHFFVFKKTLWKYADFIINMISFYSLKGRLKILFLPSVYKVK